jgi:hypothetical protein
MGFEMWVGPDTEIDDFTITERTSNDPLAAPGQLKG